MTQVGAEPSCDTAEAIMTRATTLEFPRPTLSNPDPKTLAAEILKSLNYRIGKNAAFATEHDWLTASISVVRDRVVERWLEVTKAAYDQEAKRVYYFSLEFLIGRLMRDAFSNLGLLDAMREALESLGADIDVIAALEPDAALGNGGLGRLAACFMESMATVDVPAHGYGIRYVNGMFRQEIADGWQVELPETWLDHGNPWEFERARAGVRSRLRRLRGIDHHQGRPPRAPRLASAGARAGRRLRHAGGRLARQPGQHAAAVVGACRSIRSCLPPSTPATISARSPRATRPTRCRRVLYPADSPYGRTRAAGCARSISSRRPRCRTSCSAISCNTAICRRWPTRPRSTSTTPIRPSPCPS